MLWEIEIHPAAGERDREADRVLSLASGLGVDSLRTVRSARSYLIEGQSAEIAGGNLLDSVRIRRLATSLLVDTVVETFQVHALPQSSVGPSGQQLQLLNVLPRPGVTDSVAESARTAAVDAGFAVAAARTCRKYWFNIDASEADIQRLVDKALSNAAIQQVVRGPLPFNTLSLGSTYQFQKITVPIRSLDDAALMKLSRTGQLYLSLPEMQTIRGHFAGLGRDPTDAELETIAQTWSEHCSHKTLRGRVRYRDENGEREFENLLKETIFAATATLRAGMGPDDWCVSVFQDNAGVVKFDAEQHVCIKVETHNHPSAIEPYGGANTGLGGVIRDPLGTGRGAKPVCNTDVFCFAPPTTTHASLPAGVLHPKAVATGVVAGVRDYGNRMGIPTVNGAVFFDERYLGNPLVYCGNVAMLPVGGESKRVEPGDLIVAVGGRTGRDGIHGATFSSAELTHESESLSGGAVQIGNAITEKMLMDVVLQARDAGLFTAITDCGAGGFSSAVGEMGAETGARVQLDAAPLKYSGLSYTEIWISEAQERMVLAVPEANWPAFSKLCASEGVEASILGVFTNTNRLELFYGDQQVADLSMHFLHDGRPPVIRDAVYAPPTPVAAKTISKPRYDDDLLAILGSWNVCSKEWIIRQYDHEVQAGSVVKPLVGVRCDGPSDAAVVRPNLRSQRGLVIACGMNPRYGDLDPYWMAVGAIDEAVRNCAAVGADPDRIAILDNFCWGNTERPETLGTLVRASLGCRDAAVAFRTPFVSGKDSLNNEYSYIDAAGRRQTVAIPSSLLITALGQIADVRTAVTMDLKQPGNRLYLVGATRNELGGAHWLAVNKAAGGDVPRVDLAVAPKIVRAVHAAIRSGVVRACHDLSEGGLAVSVAESAFAGEVGAKIDLRPLSTQSGISDSGVLLFSESHTRFLLEVPADHAAAFERTLSAVPCVAIGETSSDRRLVVVGVDGGAVIDSPLSALKSAWKSPLDWD